MKPIPVAFSVLGLCFSMISCGPARDTAPAPIPEKPNIIFFIADDMYPQHFNCLPEGRGRNLTPNMDRLAEEGVVMINQSVVSPVCTPSRYNCLTGNYASRSEAPEFLRKTAHEEGMTCIQWNSFITAGDKILPEYLRELGYRTGFAGKNHVMEARGLFQFPDYFADPESPEIAVKVKENYERVMDAIMAFGFDYAGGIYHNNPRWIGLEKLAVQNMDWITAAGLEFIDRNSSAPFFLYFATTLPHAPTEPEHAWKADPRVTARGILEAPPAVMPPRHTLEERIREAGLEGTGRENILWLDDALGALLEKLEQEGVADNTVIFFFNDHGQHAKGTLYQGGVMNPSIIWKQGGFACGSKSDATISNVDFAPTILDMAGMAHPDEHFDGSSFKAVLEGKKKAAAPSQYYELGYARGVRKGSYKYMAIRYPSYARQWTIDQRDSVLRAYNDQRLSMNMEIVNEDPAKPFSHLEVVPGGGVAEHASYGALPGYFEPDQLYDLEMDPGETNNLAADPAYQDVLRDMQQELRKYLDELPGTFDL